MLATINTCKLLWNLNVAILSHHMDAWCHRFSTNIYNYMQNKCYEFWIHLNQYELNSIKQKDSIWQNISFALTFSIKPNEWQRNSELPQLRARKTTLHHFDQLKTKSLLNSIIIVSHFLTSINKSPRNWYCVRFKRID